MPGIYQWESGHVPGFTPRRSHDEVPLTSISSNERLRRVIVYAYTMWNFPTGTDQFNAMNTGLVSLIEWTSAPFPPAPEPVTSGNFNDRDILDSQFHQMGPNNVFAGENMIPSAPGMIIHDTAMQRGDGVDPGIVWWVWGLPNISGTDLPYARAMLWFRVLREVFP